LKFYALARNIYQISKKFLLNIIHSKIKLSSLANF